VANLAERLAITDIVDQASLQALVAGAHAILVPITLGSGTNLKTAEALLAGKHVITTSVGLRGYEEFRDHPGVAVCDTPSSFKTAIRAAMSSPLPALDSHWRGRCSRLSWNHTLSAIPDFVKRLHDAGRAERIKTE